MRCRKEGVGDRNRERERRRKRGRERKRERELKGKKIENETMTKVSERDGQINQVNKERQKEQ